ncbi:UNVERIFIED_CONTAM: Protein Hook 1 [Siphonaria sp. JEL0065]|nr:Protein Hook 1 [Siphonaria sp. JEL0065]
MSLDLAFVDWARTFPLSHRPSGIASFCDGGLFSEILAEIDPAWFKARTGAELGDNWVLKFNGLKKTYKLVTSYYDEVLGQTHVSTALAVPNLTAIARDDDTEEVLKFAQLVVTLAVQCENNQKHIERIQSLAPESQHALMLAIEQIMSRLQEAAAFAEANDLDRPGSSAAILADEKVILEAENSSLHEQLRNLKAKYEELQAEKRELQFGMKEMQQASGQEGAGATAGPASADFVLRSQIDILKAELEKSEARREEADVLSRQQAASIKELTKKFDDASRRAEEVNHYKDQLDEFKHYADKLQKSEAMIEKYKKKMEESSDLRKQMKTLENQNSQLLERSQQLEEEYRKVSSYKPLMDTYKEQIAALESKNSSLQVENSKLEFEVNENRGKVERLDALRRNDLDQIQMLEDQVRELELMGGLAVSSEGSLGNDLNNSLRAKIAQLEQELHTVKQSGGHDRIYVLENLLEDSNRLKQKFENDFMQAYQRNLSLEHEMKQLRTVSSSDNDEVTQKLRAQLAEYQSELAMAQRRLAEAEIAITQGIGQSLGGDGSGAGGVGGAAAVDHDSVKRQMDSYEKEIRLQLLQINKLQNEKASLESQLAETRDSLIQEERTHEELKAALSAFENKTEADDTAQKVAATTQKIVLLTEQNTKVLKALKEAKKHILTQDKQIKDLKSVNPKDNFMEAITSYEAQLAEKNAEIERCKKELNDTRRAAKREQALMLSAWYDLGINQQRRLNTAQQPASGGSGSKTDQTPMSWLAQQRQESSIHGRR